MNSNVNPPSDRGTGEKKLSTHSAIRLKALQTKIQEAEDRFQVIFDNSPDGMVIINPTDNAEGPWLIEDCNKAFCEMNGYNRSELIGIDIRVVSNETATGREPSRIQGEKINGEPEDAKTHRRKYYQLLKQGPIRIEEIHKRKDGRTFPIQASSCLVILGGQERVLGIDRDITENKRGEEALQESEDKFRNLFNNAQVGMFRTRIDGSEILDINEKALSIIGRTRGEMQDSGSAILWANPREREEMVNRLKAEGQVTDFECGLLNFKGDVKRCLTSMRLYPTQAIVEGSIIDITERRKNELIQNAIYRITQTAITGNGTDVLYHSIHSILGELIPAENFFIALYDKVNNLLSFPYYVDQYDEPPPAPTQIQGLTGYVIRTGRPLLANRETFERLVQRGYVEAVGTVSEDWLGAPLKVEGRMIGVMAVQSYTQGIHFNQQDMDLLEFVSTQVALAIERKRLEEEIRGLSLTDELTGLYNRRGFTLLAEQEVKLAHRLKRSMLLFFGDVDKLKTINDTLGHTHGDLVLKEVSAILKETFRESDLLARIGGDEFVALALDASKESGEIISNRLQAALLVRNQQRNEAYHLSLSFGVAPYDPEDPCTLSELIARADGLMYQQKQAKKRKK